MARQGKRRKIAKNIYADDRGLAAFARAGHLRREKRYPKDTLIRTIRSWQKDTEAELRKLLGTPAAAKQPPLREEVPRYLDLIREEFVGIENRERDIGAWLPRFGHRRRRTLKTAELDKQLRHWRNVDGLSASTVNQRRDALSMMFRVLDGSEASNPVKGCVWFARAKAIPKGIDRGRIVRVLAAMDPDRKTRWRLSLMHWTGMRPSQMGRLRGPEDFFVDDRAFQIDVNGTIRRVAAVLVPSGKGGDPVMMPLLGDGEDIARHFMRVDAFWRPPKKPRRRKDGRLKKPSTTWSTPSAYKRIVEAAKKVDEQPFTVYTIKHSFASALRRTGTDLNDIQDMLGHADIKSTKIYAPAVQAKHVQALDRLRDDDARRYTGSARSVTVAPKGGTSSAIHTRNTEVA